MSLMTMDTCHMQAVQDVQDNPDVQVVLVLHASTHMCACGAMGCLSRTPSSRFGMCRAVTAPSQHSYDTVRGCPSYPERFSCVLLGDDTF